VNIRDQLASREETHSIQRLRLNGLTGGRSVCRAVEDEGGRALHVTNS
jgi:hypothetical protein